MRAPRPRWLITIGLALFVLPQALFLYLLMPLPGSQGLESLDAAWVVHRARVPVQAAGALLVLAGAAVLARRGARLRSRILVAVACALGVAAVWKLDGFMAGSMFLPPVAALTFASGPTAAVPAESIVLGVVVNGRPRAYPVRLLAYHHLVRDRIAGEPLLPTY